ncbi:transposase [Bacillus thuringiensis]|uniref:Transposase n=1 Tax=Bacillus thuringiensis TaxID=1428 RepID=A0AAW9JNG4_BACTU|nr:transposase [Bacillus thuringiensis]MDZ5480104.1 transposase [Bacillus thuringiensis]
MKNHVIVNDQILQKNKKWSNLKQNQQHMITEWLQAEYQRFIKVHLRKPKKKEEEYILDIVMEQIRERDIWIPYQEVKKYFTNKKEKWYRKLENELESRRKEEEKLVHVAYESIGTTIL